MSEEGQREQLTGSIVACLVWDMNPAWLFRIDPAPIPQYRHISHRDELLIDYVVGFAGKKSEGIMSDTVIRYHRTWNCLATTAVHIQLSLFVSYRAVS